MGLHVSTGSDISALISDLNEKGIPPHKIISVFHDGSQYVVVYAQ